MTSAAPSSSPDDAVTPSPSILFVDDEPSVLAALRRSLRRHRGEFDMHFSASGADALALLPDLRPDIVVSDFKMPGIDGGELLAHVREHHPRSSRIILSGHVDEADMVRAAGTAHQFLSKPCDNAVLVDTLRSTARRWTAFPASRVRDRVSSTVLPPGPIAERERLAHLVTQDDPDIDALAALVAASPGLSAKMLQLVNSAFFGASRRISDPRQAVALVGPDLVRALVASLQDVGDNASDAWLSRLTARSAGRADRAEAMAPGAGVDAGLARAAALLLDVGNFVVGPPAADPSPSGDHSLATDPVDPTAVGALLLGLWGLPSELTDAVTNHGRQPRSALDEVLASAQSRVDAEMPDDASPVPHPHTNTLSAVA